MFIQNLSQAIQVVCCSKGLTYTAAAARCGISSRYFRKLIKAGAAPSIMTLEKLCVGLKCSPDTLLNYSGITEDISYRTARPVIHYRRYQNYPGGCGCFPVCPRCDASLEVEYQAFCDRCGQKLRWGSYGHATRRASRDCEVCE